MSIKQVVNGIHFKLHELVKKWKFARNVRRGVIKQEPRFRPIIRIAANIYDGYPAGTVEYAHVARYDFAKDLVSGHVLNAAAGSGYGNEILMRSGASVLGLDLYEKPLQLAKVHFPNHEFIRGNILDLGMFPENVFDAVVSFETIEHIPDPERGVLELKRVLKPEGHFVGSIPIQIFHNPGTNFTHSEAKHFINKFFQNSQLFLQTNMEIMPWTQENWRRIRFEGNKYLLFHWKKPAR